MLEARLLGLGPGHSRVITGGGGVVSYISAPLVNHVQVHIIQSVDFHYCLVRRCMQRDQNQLFGHCGKDRVSRRGGGGTRSEGVLEAG